MPGGSQISYTSKKKMPVKAGTNERLHMEQYVISENLPQSLKA